MPLFRRVIISAFSLVLTHLGLLAPAGATTGGCDASCKQQQIVWYWHAEQTLAREWYASMILATPQAQCVIDHESRYSGMFSAKNSVSTASGAFQFLDTTAWTWAARMGRYDLVGIPARYWTWYDQALAFGEAWDENRGRDWAPDGCWRYGPL